MDVFWFLLGIVWFILFMVMAGGGETEISLDVLQLVFLCFVMAKLIEISEKD